MSQTKRKKAITKFLAFGATPLIIFIGVLVYPFLQGLFLTFTDWDGFDYTKVEGIQNYKDSLTDPHFWTTMAFTLKFVVVSVILVNLVAFGLALLVTSTLKSSNLFRTFFLDRKSTRLNSSH